MAIDFYFTIYIYTVTKYNTIIDMTFSVVNP